MANELDLNKLIEKYSVLGQLHQTRDQRLPLRIPENLTAGEYYNLAEQYIQCRWVHHALESLQRAADLNPEWMSEIDHLRKTTLPPVIPEVEAVEANLLARNAFHFKSNIDYNDPSTFDSAYALAQFCVQMFPTFDGGYLTLGRLERIRRNHRAAISTYEKALELNPFCVETMIEIGDVWLAQVKILKAKKWFEKALQCDPDNSQAPIALESVQNFLIKPMWLLSCKYRWVGALERWRQQRNLRKIIRDVRKKEKENPDLFVPKVRSGFIDRSGIFVFYHDAVRQMSRFSGDFFCCVQKRKSALFIDKKGRDAFGGREFRWAENFSEGFACVLVGEKWGFIELHGDFVIEPQFEDVGNFKDGLAAARRNGLWGFIDKKGEWRIAPRYENVLPFSEERAPVSLDGKIAIIDSHGEPITDFEFDEVGRFADGLVRTVRYETEVERHAVKFLDREGNVAFDLNRVYLDLFGDGTIGYGTQDNRYRDTDVYLFAGPGSSRHTLSSGSRHTFFGKPTKQFSDGRLRVNQGTKCGYLDRSGALVIPLEFYVGDTFSDGMASVSLDPVQAFPKKTEEHSVKTFAFINRDGEIAIRLEPGHYARSFSSGLAYVYDNNGGRWFIDQTGNKVFELGDNMGLIGDFHGELAAVERSPDLYP